jgi:sirohydrochlorin cobaltochelatase
VAELVLARYAEAVGESVLMNCDACQYRSPWPGREKKVGQLQRPHAHPADV